MRIRILLILCSIANIPVSFAMYDLQHFSKSTLTVNEYVRCIISEKKERAMQACAKEWQLSSDDLAWIRDQEWQVRFFDIAHTSWQDIDSTIPEFVIKSIKSCMQRYNISGRISIKRNLDPTSIDHAKVQINYKHIYTDIRYTLLLSDDFFNLSANEQQGCLLHEIGGHFMERDLITRRFLRQRIKQQHQIDESVVRQSSSYKQLIDLFEYAADQLPASADYTSAKNVEAFLNVWYQQGKQCSLSPIERYKNVQIIRKLFELNK